MGGDVPWRVRGEKRVGCWWIVEKLLWSCGVESRRLERVRETSYR